MKFSSFSPPSVSRLASSFNKVAPTEAKVLFKATRSLRLYNDPFFDVFPLEVREGTVSRGGRSGNNKALFLLAHAQRAGARVVFSRRFFRPKRKAKTKNAFLGKRKGALFCAKIFSADGVVCCSLFSLSPMIALLFQRNFKESWSYSFRLFFLDETDTTTTNTNTTTTTTNPWDDLSFVREIL